MSCYKTKNTCAKPHPAECTSYETEVPESSVLFEVDCLSIEDTTADLYDRTEEIINEIDLSELGLDCLTYVQEGGKNVVKNVLLKYEEEICTLKQEIEDLKGKTVCDITLQSCGITPGTATDQCSDPITTVGELLQFLVDQHQA